ncbi:adhesive domain-containing protein [Candidatus Enterococcus clewellii]|uniref:adhesive domain-containing protein n=1 Tax=Candidatus Enterococcus clewellii TaxID=1834193 RepID=UPI0014831519|nr:adhesive domain-containing protein [Enterococcus sp. 9E7_DIV0242]
MRVKGGRNPKKLKRFLSKKNFFVCYFVINLVVAGGFTGVLSYFFNNEEASAAVLDVEILSNMQTSNNSNTSSTVRWQPTVTNQPVNFTISGAGLANVSANLVGKKYGVLVIPSQLSGKVTPNGNAQVDTNVTVDLSKVALLKPTFDALDGLITLIDNIQKGALSLVGVSFDLTEVNKQLALLDSLETLGHTTYSATTVGDARSIYLNMDEGLGTILAGNLRQILVNLNTAVQNLKVTVTTPIVGDAVAAVINPVLNTVKPALNTAITTLLPALGVGGAAVQQLADASVLGQTTITLPTFVSGPGSITSNLDARFVGTVIKSSVIDIDLLNTANATSYIYFAGETFAMNNTLLPDALNFGVHPIQTKLDELFTATAGGVSGAAQTTGTVSVTDTRSTTKNWQVKVAQSGQWKNTSSYALSMPILKIYGGTMTTDYSAGVRSISGRDVELIDGSQQEVLAVSNVTASGTTSLTLPKFDLFVPKNTVKKIGQYKTTLIWTVTESP